MSQCVPSWGLDDAPHLPPPSTPHVPSLDYEVAELTWENGQLAMHGLGPPRSGAKPAVSFLPPVKYASASWEKPRAGAGTLESLVNQATTTNCHVPQLENTSAGGENANGNDLAPWFDHRRAVVHPGAGVTMDALVPCGNNHHDHREGTRHVKETVGTRAARAGMCSFKTNVSESTATCGDIAERRQVTAAAATTIDTGERELGEGGFASTSMWSPENTSSGKEYTKTTSGDDHDSVCHSQSKKEGREDHEGEVRKKKGNGKSSVLTKRSRASAIHNQSERKRRDKINQRMKTLQKLVPNSSKTDKASILDEVIEHLKQLQAQVQMMSRMSIPQMMLPLALQHQQQQQQLQMSMMGLGMGMGMGVMDFNSLGRATGMQPIIPPPASGVPPVIPPPAAFMPMASWDMQGDRLASAPIIPDLLSTLLACQSQPTTMEAYSRLAALYQQLQQGQGLGSGSGSVPKN